MSASVFRRSLALFSSIDWVLTISALFISCAGLVTLYLFSANNTFFERQLIWLAVSLVVFFIFAHIDFRFLRGTTVVTLLYVGIAFLLAAIYIVGTVTLGAQSRFDLGFFAVQPADPAKLVIIILLAKYFSRRHVEIAHIRHILVSGAYAFFLFVLILLQPDFGSALIIAAIWFSVVLVSGISKRHLAFVCLTALIAGAGLWTFVFEDYQKTRILTFLHPLADVQGDGYNAYQAAIAVGSGETLGKGVGYGTQSKLQFLPEYETDFIFAAFAEEWGFVGVILLFALYGMLFSRIIAAARFGATNFETLFAVGVAALFLTHFLLHVGINLGLLPVTGTTVPLMSYGGSHLLTEWAALGILMGMRRYAKSVHHAEVNKEVFVQ